MNKIKSGSYLIPMILVGILLIAGYSVLQTVRKPEHDLDVIAQVGPREIRAEQFKAEMIRRGGSNPGNIDKNKLLEEMIDYETLLVKAYEAGMDKDPDIVRSFQNMLVGKIRQRDLKTQIDAVTVTDEEIKNWYDAHLDLYTQPAKIRVAILYMKTDSFMSAEKISEIRKKMAEARQKAVSESANATGFGPLAIDYSVDQASRYRGGDIGWLLRGRAYRWDPAVIEAAFSLERVGDISDIVRTDSGLYLVKLTDRAEASVTSLERVKNAVRHKLLTEKRKAVEKAFQENIRASIPIRTFPKVLETIDIPLVPENQMDGDKLPSLK